MARVSMSPIRPVRLCTLIWRIAVFGIVALLYLKIRYFRSGSDYDQLRNGSRQRSKYSPSSSTSWFRSGRQPAVELVVSSMTNTSTSWIHEFFPHYPAHIYIADDPTAELSVERNVGHESNVYLTYILNNYHKLPDVVIFLHGRRYQWHNEDRLYDGVPVLQKFRIPHVLEHGFSTLRCSWQLGCPVELTPDLNALPKWDDPDADQRAKTEAAYAKAYIELFPGDPIPKTIATNCGAQFAVTKERIRLRSKEEYRRYQSWLWTTNLTDEFSGRVMEYSWHQILGQPAMDCMPAKPCFCEKFGMCDLECPEEGKCLDQYFFKFGELPARWPDEGPGEDGWPTCDWRDPLPTGEGQPEAEQATGQEAVSENIAQSVIQ